MKSDSNFDLKPPSLIMTQTPEVKPLPLKIDNPYAQNNQVDAIIDNTFPLIIKHYKTDSPEVTTLNQVKNILVLYKEITLNKLKITDNSIKFMMPENINVLINLFNHIKLFNEPSWVGTGVATAAKCMSQVAEAIANCHPNRKLYIQD